MCVHCTKKMYALTSFKSGQCLILGHHTPYHSFSIMTKMMNIVNYFLRHVNLYL